MKLAVVGSSGYIADFLLKQLEQKKEIKKILKIGRSETADAYLDLQEAEKFDYSLLNEINFVIFTAAVSGPDQCAEEYHKCWEINVVGTSHFIRKALDKGCRVLFFSSDAVYESISGSIYNEKSDTKPTTPYGEMKKAVENEFKYHPLCKVLRLSYVVSAKDKFTSYCMSCMKRNVTAEIFHPFYRNCISIKDVIDIITWFLFHFDEYHPYVLNVAGRELISRVRIADEINQLYNGKLKYIITIPDNKFFINRPRITQMESLYLQEYHILDSESFTEKIQKELKGINHE